MIFSEKINQGVIYMLISAACLSFMGAFAKIVAEDMPTIEIIFFRNFIGVILISLTVFKTPIIQVGGKPWLLIFRAVIGFLAMLSFFYNLANIPLADAVTYSRLSPIFTALFAFWFLKEKIGSRGWLAIALGFLGMLLVMQPFSTGVQKSHIFGLINAVCAALAFTSIRELRRYYDTRTIVLYFMGIGLIVPIISMLFSEFYSNDFFAFMMGKFTTPQGVDWFYLIGIGVFSAIGQIYMTKAYGVTKAGIVGAAGYSVILFSMIIGLVLGDALPNALAILGIVGIVSAGLLIASEKSEKQ